MKIILVTGANRGIGLALTRVLLASGKVLAIALGKAVRGLRQRRAYYRCCIPALAGFVCQRSIAPDGSISMD